MTKFTHVRLLVSDVQACLLFYRDVLGLDVLWADEDGHYVSFKTWIVHIGGSARRISATPTET